VAVKKSKKRPAKKRLLANAVRSHTRRLQHSQVTETHVAPDPAAPASAEPLDFPKDLVDGRQTDGVNKLPSVMLVITILALLFIGLIAWFVAQMPAK
jgi:hypothetical protein